jgi:hypothetical protein
MPDTGHAGRNFQSNVVAMAHAIEAKAAPIRFGAELLAQLVKKLSGCLSC